MACVWAPGSPSSVPSGAWPSKFPRPSSVPSLRAAGRGQGSALVGPGQPPVETPRFKNQSSLLRPRPQSTFPGPAVGVAGMRTQEVPAPRRGYCREGDERPPYFRPQGAGKCLPTGRRHAPSNSDASRSTWGLSPTPLATLRRSTPHPAHPPPPALRPLLIRAVFAPYGPRTEPTALPRAGPRQPPLRSRPRPAAGPAPERARAVTHKICDAQGLHRTPSPAPSGGAAAWAWLSAFPQPQVITISPVTAISPVSAVPAAPQP